MRIPEEERGLYMASTPSVLEGIPKSAHQIEAEEEWKVYYGAALCMLFAFVGGVITVIIRVRRWWVILIVLAVLFAASQCFLLGSKTKKFSLAVPMGLHVGSGGAYVVLRLQGEQFLGLENVTLGAATAQQISKGRGTNWWPRFMDVSHDRKY
jgi:hypothetical protein